MEKMINGLDADKLNNGTPMHDERESPKIDLVDQWHKIGNYLHATTDDDVKMNNNNNYNINASQISSANAMDIDAKQTIVSMDVPQAREVLAWRKKNEEQLNTHICILTPSQTHTHTYTRFLNTYFVYGAIFPSISQLFDPIHMVKTKTTNKMINRM